MRPRAWDEGLDTGIADVDAEHRLQVSLVNALEAVLRQGKDQALAEKTLQQLVDFTSVHFLSEELMMRLHAYPGHDAHALEHGRLLDQVQAIRRASTGGDRASALQLIEALRSWLVSHIKSMDQGFALWCARNGIRPESRLP
jgi:hemerythrin-like metal-binding protein